MTLNWAVYDLERPRTRLIDDDTYLVIPYTWTSTSPIRQEYFKMNAIAWDSNGNELAEDYRKGRTTCEGDLAPDGEGVYHRTTEARYQTQRATATSSSRSIPLTPTTSCSFWSATKVPATRSTSGTCARTHGSWTWAQQRLSSEQRLLVDYMNSDDAGLLGA
ncbi:MAG: hypothetical protein ACI855_004001 [Myxococcota bacterium]|jgi:hypothetical protein